MEHYAIIGRIKTSPIEGANTIKMAYYNGLPFVVGKEYNEEDLYVIFLPDGRISKEYAEANDLIQRINPETGKNEGGFFGKNRKVRSIKLMQGKVVSVGFIAPLSSLAFTGVDESLLKEGMEFSELNGVPICGKFVTETSMKARKQGRGGKREVPGLLMHPDTQQFYKEYKSINEGDLITISLKLDGTSVRVGNTYEDIVLKWWHKILSKIIDVAKTKFSHKYGSRRVVMEDGQATFFGAVDPYGEVAKRLEGKLFPGESVYGEIVGWIDEERPMFVRGGTKFLYNTQPGTRDFYIYNITWTLPNGQKTNLSWPEIKYRAMQLGEKVVPELKRFIFDGNYEELERVVWAFAEGPDPIDPSHIREGVVLRIESESGLRFLKCKSAEYYTLEDVSKNAGEADIEEAQDA